MRQLDDVIGPLLGGLAEAIGPEAADTKAVTVLLLADPRSTSRDGLN